MERALVKSSSQRQLNKIDEIDLKNFITPIIAEKWLVIGITMTIFLISLILCDNQSAYLSSKCFTRSARCTRWLRTLGEWFITN